MVGDIGFGLFRVRESYSLEFQSSQRLADLTDLISLRFAVLFRLEVQEDQDAGASEDVMVAFDPQTPAWLRQCLPTQVGES